MNPWAGNIARWAKQGQTEGPGLTTADRIRHFRMGLATFAFTAISSPFILLSVFLFFAVLCGSGIAVVQVIQSKANQNREAELRGHSVELASFFQQDLNKAFVPLFTIRTVAVMNPSLTGLSQESESWPIRTEEDGSLSTKFRDVSQLYDTTVGQHQISEFDILAADILAGSEVSDAILNIQLAPGGVTSLIHPLEGNEGAKGHDLLLDPNRRPDALKTVNTNDMTMAGPVPLVQGGEMMIGRLAIWIDPERGYGWDTRTMEGVMQEIEPGKVLWGFSTVLFSFQKVLEASALTAKLDRFGLVFNLTGTQSSVGADGQTINEVFVLAQSVLPDGEEMMDSVSLDVQVPNKVWTLTLAFRNGFRAVWPDYAYSGVVLGSAVMAGMLLLVMVSRKQHTALLHKMLPKFAVHALERGGAVVSVFDTATIFFSDIVGFTEMAQQMAPIEVMELLNDLYEKFDVLAEKHQVYKVETIGDAYMVVGGCPDRVPGPEGAARVVAFALDALACVEAEFPDIKIRCGIASGPIVAGVVGKKMPRYSLFGDTVNSAARMESTSLQGRLQLSDVSATLLNKSSRVNDFIVTRRRPNGNAPGIWVKGKGYMTTYWVQPNRAGVAAHVTDDEDDLALATAAVVI